MEDYFLGSRGLGMLALALTFGATSASAGSFAGFPALIYTHGWVLAVWIASYMIFPLCGMGLLGKRLNQIARKSGAITLPEVLRARFDSRSIAILSTAILALLLTVYLIPQFKLAALIMERMFVDIPQFHDIAGLLQQNLGNSIPGGQSPEYFLCLMVFAILVIFYTALGGFRAVVWTDMLQGGVMIVGVLIMLVLAIYQVGGLDRATHHMMEMEPPRIGEVVFHRDDRSSEGRYRIPTDTWFVIEDTENFIDAQVRLFRSNQTALIQDDQVVSLPVPVVEVMSTEEKRRVLVSFEEEGVLRLPPGVTPEIIQVSDYSYGAYTKGVYVTAPGPSPSEINGFLPVGLALSFFVFWSLSGTGQPGNMVRLMAFDSSKTLKKGIAALSIYFSLIYIPLVIIFCCARILMPGLDQAPDRIMPVMAVLLTENAGVVWLAGLIIAAPFAAAMSTVDSFMLMISSSLVRDIYQKEMNPGASPSMIKKLSYGCTVAIGLLATVGAAYPPQFLQYVIVFSGGALACAFLGPVALGLYWSRCSKSGAIAAMVVGLTVYLVLYGVGFVQTGSTKPFLLLGLDPLIWGVVCSLLGAVFVTYLTPPPNRELIERFF